MDMTLVQVRVNPNPIPCLSACYQPGSPSVTGALWEWGLSRQVRLGLDWLGLLAALIKLVSFFWCFCCCVTTLKALKDPLEFRTWMKTTNGPELALILIISGVTEMRINCHISR